MTKPTPEQLKRAVEFAKKNPNAPQSKQLQQMIESGNLNNELRAAGFKKYDFGNSKSETPATQAPDSFRGKFESNPIVKGINAVGGAQGNLGIGALKSAGGTIYDALQLGEKVANKTGLTKIGPAIGRFFGGSPVEQKPIFQGGQPDFLQPKGTAQKVGGALEKAAEFFIPAGKVATAEKAIDSVLTGSRLLRGISKAGLEAASGAGVSLVQSGGNFKEAAKTGAIFGGTKLATGLTGELLRSAKIPERLYSRIFKNNYRDMTDELRATGIANYAKQNPEKYKELLDSGIVKNGLGGKPVLRESLAKEALDRGLKGSLPNMANAVVGDTLELELATQKAIKSAPKKLVIGSPEKLRNVLLETAQRYENVGNGAISKEAQGYASKVRRGVVDAETGLKLRRFLDGMRLRSSYDSTAKSLSQSQENFKYWSDHVRQALSKDVPGIKKIMNDYRFNIEALESISKEATRRGNNQVLGLIDSIFLSGFAINPTSGAGTIGLARKALESPRVLTNIASKINSSGTLSRIGTAVKGAASLLTNENRQ